MPRQARIDAPGALHHIIVRGIERLRIFSDNQDRDNFIERLGDIVTEIETLDNSAFEEQIEFDCSDCVHFCRAICCRFDLSLSRVFSM